MDQNNNTDLLDKQLLEAEQQYFKNNLSQKQQNYLKAERLAMLSMQAKHMNNENAWFNKLDKMTD